MEYVPVLVAAIASFVLGWAWYSPALFAKQWMAWSGVKPGKGNMATSMTLGLVGQVVTAAVLAWILQAMNVTVLAQGLKYAAVVWLGFVGTTTMGSVLWEGKPWKLWALNNAHNLLSLLVIAAIVLMWP